MSYARFGEADSDVYVIYDGEHLICFCEPYRLDTCEQMIAHLRGHEAKGDIVPARTFERLEAEARDGIGSHNPLKKITDGWSEQISREAEDF